MKTAHQRIQEISKVMKRAVEKAAEKHRLMGVPMAVWKDGKVVEFLPKPPPRHLVATTQILSESPRILGWIAEMPQASGATAPSASAMKESGIRRCIWGA